MMVHNKGNLSLIVLLIVVTSLLFVIVYIKYSQARIENNLTTPSTEQDYLLYKDEKFGISFKYPPYLDVSANWDGGGEDPTRWWRILMQYNDREIENYDLKVFEILEGDNPGGLSPEEYFNSVKYTYNDSIQKLANITISGSSALLTGMPSTCKSAPGFYVFIANKNKILVISQISKSERRENVELLKTILKSLSLNNDPLSSENYIPSFTYPSQPATINCGNE